MKTTDEVVTEHLGPPVVPRGQRRFFLVAVAAAAAVFLGLFLFAGGVCTCSPPPSTPAGVPTPDIRSPLDGVIIAVDSSGLTDVRGFTLRPSNGGGFAFSFTLGDLENPTEFPPGHLGEHLASSEPVRVHFRTVDGVHIAYRLEDAP